MSRFTDDYITELVMAEVYKSDLEPEQEASDPTPQAPSSAAPAAEPKPEPKEDFDREYEVIETEREMEDPQPERVLNLGTPPNDGHHLRYRVGQTLVDVRRGIPVEEIEGDSAEICIEIGDQTPEGFKEAAFKGSIDHCLPGSERTASGVMRNGKLEHVVTTTPVDENAFREFLKNLSTSVEPLEVLLRVVPRTVVVSPEEIEAKDRLFEILTRAPAHNDPPDVYLTWRYMFSDESMTAISSIWVRPARIEQYPPAVTRVFNEHDYAKHHVGPICVFLYQLKVMAEKVAKTLGAKTWAFTHLDRKVIALLDDAVEFEELVDFLENKQDFNYPDPSSTEHSDAIVWDYSPRRDELTLSICDKEPTPGGLNSTKTVPLGFYSYVTTRKPHSEPMQSWYPQEVRKLAAEATKQEGIDLWHWYNTPPPLKDK